ncbi:uncharacterized protein LOC132720116 [Ruditapes philippinarum]|uniref:uncharacterized protein LOC132720116 n=1 Tax=Ruditapes philippinarum TaxID=129788 RepID=UPI00295B5A6F|nr:uncharacterized protein LOC132720116 [Ruditapes philippinarum]
MFQEPDYRENLSLMLSEVLDDIGVNERMVMRRRRRYMLKETMSNIRNRSIDLKLTEYHLGSQTEGSTTIGLNSDIDILVCVHDFNIIQDWSEWEHGKKNYLMIQDENTTPGYCFLQLLHCYEPRPATVIPKEHHINNRRGRILLKNTIFNGSGQGFLKHGPSGQCIFKHGPSYPVQGGHGMCDTDTVPAFSCKSWPQSASGWLDRQGIGRWPTQDMRRYIASTGCFVVPTGSKVSKYPDLEWRISTTLAERCLTFNLNITQIRCYVLLKMVLKSFLNPHGEINISSFMCKTVLFHCIENTESSIWKENNLIICLTYCLLELQSCVQNNCCSHFIIRENNLMAGQFTAGKKHELLKNMSDYLQNDRQMLLRIDIDDLGHRLQVKLNMVPQRAYHYEIKELYMFCDYLNTAYVTSINHMAILKYLQKKAL